MRGPRRRAEHPRLVTTGAIDPLRLRWGDTSIRFGGADRRRPVVALAAPASSDPGLASWVGARLVPKVLVASQGRVVEAVLDEVGHLVPSTPVVSVEPRPGVDVTPAHLAALLSSPVASAWVHRQAAGSGLGAGRCRVSARLLTGLPLPADRAGGMPVPSSPGPPPSCSARGCGTVGALLDALRGGDVPGVRDRRRPPRRRLVARWQSRMAGRGDHGRRDRPPQTELATGVATIIARRTPGGRARADRVRGAGARHRPDGRFVRLDGRRRPHRDGEEGRAEQASAAGRQHGRHQADDHPHLRPDHALRRDDDSLHHDVEHEHHDHRPCQGHVVGAPDRPVVRAGLPRDRVHRAHDQQDCRDVLRDRGTPRAWS